MLVYLFMIDILTNSDVTFINHNIFENLCVFFVPVSSNYLKKVKTIVDNLLIEKQKMEKGDKAKKNKGKGKAKLKIEGDNTLLSGDYVYDEYDDFM